MMAPAAHAPGIARACAECHKRKIKCDVQDDGVSCSNCRLYGTTCQLRARKRRKTNNDSSVGDSTEARQAVSGALSRRRSNQNNDFRPGLTGDIPSAALSPLAVDVQDTGVDVSRAHSQAPNGAETLEYADYYGHHAYLKAKLEGDRKRRTVTLTDKDKQILRIQNSFTFPAEPLKADLISSFMSYCFPWVPIFDQKWLWDGKHNGSPALTQAVLVAGARTSDSAIDCHEYYSAAKFLLLCGHETNPIIMMVACLLLGWWNQTSPDIVSFDNSTSWIRQAVGVAYQIDLHKEPRNSRGASYRRRLWWTLVARDSQVSASHGRPRYINLAICPVQPISLDDMPDSSNDAKVFVAYVRASIILGDLAETCQQGKMTTPRFAELRNALLWWLKELPESIKYVEPASQANFNMRQVYMLFVSTVAILYRSIRGSKTPPAVELIASSFVVGLARDFHRRDELRRLSAGFTFYPLVAAIPLQEALVFQPLEDTIREEIAAIESTLQELGKRWPSAHRGLKVMERISQKGNSDRPSSSTKPSLATDSDLFLFENFDQSKCGIWSALMESQPNGERQDLFQAPRDLPQQEKDIPYMAIPSGVAHEQPATTTGYNFDPSDAMSYDDLTFWFSDSTFDQDIFGGWMLNNDTFGSNLNL